MLSLSYISRPHPDRGDHAVSAFAVPTLAASLIGSRFASPRASLVGSPSFSRPNLFSGD
jgi:hypothetical protein